MGPDSMLRWFAQNWILLRWSYLGLQTYIIWVPKLSTIYLYTSIWYATSSDLSKLGFGWICRDQPSYKNLFS